MKEVKIEDIIEFEGIKYKKVPTNKHLLCDGCAFYQRSHNDTCKEIVEKFGYCSTNDTIYIKYIEDNDVANPAYYGAGNGIECIDVMIQQYGEEEVKSFCKCNAFKYLFRCGHKNDPLEEMKKVQWYINKWIELQERKCK